ncbi:MAG TPA: hypothetical protein VFT42_07940 [Solirubrobacteraceae bacterium]|nr:hypothetical protein [Solirubrobacteraceae bacterium]
MFEKPLRILSVLCTAFVVLSFVFFTIDQSSKGSQDSVSGIAADGPPSSAIVQHKKPAHHDAARRAIDSVDKRLVDPFNGLAGGSSNDWVKRGVPSLFALFVYGFGLSYIARYAKVRA